MNPSAQNSFTRYCICVAISATVPTGVQWPHAVTREFNKARSYPLKMPADRAYALWYFALLQT